MTECIFTVNRYKDKDGYPRAKYQGRSQGVHRIMYQLIHGEIPEGMVVGHSCNNKGCVNPRHHYLTTAAVNSEHAARDGLYRSGERNHKTKLRAEDYAAIRLAYSSGDVSQKLIAERFGISQSRVSEIINEEKNDR